MRIGVIAGKLLGSLAIAFVGYFIMAAVGWPEPLESMAMERRFVGGSVILLGALCAIVSFMPQRRKPRSASAMLFDEQPAEATPVPPPGALAPVPTPAPTPDPFIESPPAPPVPEAANEAEPPADALAKARQLHAAAPGDETQDLLASALRAVGDANSKAARPDLATAAYEEALEIRLARLEATPGDPERKRHVSLVLQRLADVRQARGHVARALNLYRQSLPLAEGLAASDPANTLYRDDLENTRRRLAELEGQITPPV